MTFTLTQTIEKIRAAAKTATVDNRPVTLSLEQQHMLLEKLCDAQEIVNTLKSHLEPFIGEGETIACARGKLTKSKEGSYFDWTAAGKVEYKKFQATALAKGLGKMRTSKPGLRLTLTGEVDS